MAGREAAVSAEDCGWLPGAHRSPSKGAAAALLQQSGPMGEWKWDVAGNADFSSGAKNLDFYVNYLSDQLPVTNSIFFKGKKKEKNYRKHPTCQRNTSISWTPPPVLWFVCFGPEQARFLIRQAQVRLSEKG